MNQFSDELKQQRPEDINLLKMIESRIMEIVQIENDCKKKLPKLFNQRLPRFMRRRAACHDRSRLPERLRSLLGPISETPASKKAKIKLLRYKRKMLYLKRKRKRRLHDNPLLKNPKKSLLHKWFAKRFKMDSDHVPVHNSTKNQRNLKRQLRYGCAYLSFLHMNTLDIIVKEPAKNLKLVRERLNQLTKTISGFTFCAQALNEKRYEVCVHLYETVKQEEQDRQYICPALVSIRYDVEEKDVIICLWVNRNHIERISKLIEFHLEDLTKKPVIEINRVEPRDTVRIRLVGQNAYEEVGKVIEDKSLHKAAIEDAEKRLPKRLGSSIGRFYVPNCYTNCIYYNTYPRAVDIVLRNREGKLEWHKMIKNKAHLVGGYRDVERLLTDDCFMLKPDA